MSGELDTAAARAPSAVQESGQPEPAVPVTLDTTVPAVRKQKMHETFASDGDALEFAAEMAADMEMGLYMDAAGKVWDPRRFVIAEILRRMEYGKHYIEDSRRPRWWPKGGLTAFTSYIQWKMAQRRLAGKVKFEQIAPWLEGLLGLAIPEMARRLTLEPQSVAFRDLTELTTKITRAFALQGRSPAVLDGGGMSPQGADAYLSITAAFKHLPEGPARDRVMAQFDRSVQAAKAAMALGDGKEHAA